MIMRLKLTKAQFKTLLGLLQMIMLIERPKGIERRLLHTVLIRLYKKFYKKAIEEKSKYTVNLECDEACAFYMFFSRWMPADAQADPFTVNLVTQINNSIHQKYAV